MYAIVEAGGKQHRVSPGDVLRVEKMDVAVGEGVTLDKVLMFVNDNGVTIGTPYVGEVSLTCEVLGHGREKKIAVFHYKRKKNIRKFQGHRQYYTDLKIKEICC